LLHNWLNFDIIGWMSVRHVGHDGSTHLEHEPPTNK
jgi:hypothetical protein